MPRLSFQDLILRLQNFWAERGCMIETPLDLEVGAGTMHPATFLRVLGPEPWNVGYVQPSRRPADGRYGDNPFRLGKHYQFQVILKPSPLEVQELYLDSLRAIGLDLTRHDIRFEEDNWESPTLGAWGVGWQILLDGMEITQFTYFQQAGGLDLAPISEEITAWMHDAAQNTLREKLAPFGGKATVTTTPRRIIFYLAQLEEREADRVQDVKGPPKKAAYDASGNPTQALNGFLKKNNAAIEDIIDGGAYVIVRRNCT